MARLNDVIRYVFDQVIALVPIPKLPDALVAVQPLIGELLQSDVVLSEEVRIDLQVKVIRILRTAGLQGADASLDAVAP